MMSLIVAAALAAQPAAPAPNAPMAQHEMPMQMGQGTDHKDMDCCKECCKHMAKHKGYDAEPAEHNAH